MITLINLAVGALIKLFSGGLTLWFDFKRQKELAILNVHRDTIVALQSGTDRADESTRWTRRILALMIIGSWVFIMIRIILHPDITFTIQVGRSMSWIWEWLIPFPINDKGVMTLSAGGLLWEYKTMVEVLIGFYFTKIGR